MSAGAGIVEISAGVLRYLAGDLLTGAEAWPEAGLRDGTILFLPDGGVLSMRAVVFTGGLREMIRGGQVDPSREVYLAESTGAFRVRAWQAGDRFRPLGAPGSAKLQDLFVNRKIPAMRRSQLPVVVGEDGGIRWVPGFPPADESKITHDSVTGLHLTYETGTYTVRP